MEDSEMNKKIAMIGGGSIAFCKTLMSDIMATPARFVKQTQYLAETREYPCYLVCFTNYTSSLIKQLSKQYKYDHIPRQEGQTTEDAKFVRAGMVDYLLFDLTGSAKGS